MGARLAKVSTPSISISPRISLAKSEQANILRRYAMTSAHTSSDAAEAVISALLWQAKRLHRGACSDAKVTALPILRRLLASQVIRDVSLPALFKQRAMIQRKHLLHMLAMEAGEANWQDYRRLLVAGKGHSVIDTDKHLRDAGYPNLWFSSFDQAQRHAEQHGGRAVAVSTQGVVLVEG